MVKMSTLPVESSYLFSQSILSPTNVAILAATVLVIVLSVEAFKSDFARVAGIPEVPFALPFVGHLHQLGGRSGKNDATVFTDWGKGLRSSVFQCVLGNQRTIVVSDWATMKDLWVGQSHSLLDRPHQPGFVDKLGIDLTGSSMTDQVRKCRAAGMRALAKPNWPKYYHLLEPSSGKFISWLYKSSNNGGNAIDTYIWLRQIVFDLCLSLTYGARFGEVDDEFMLKFIKSINDISAVRSSTKTYRHFIPLLRLIPEATSETIAAERVRRKHRDELYGRYRSRVSAGETVDCIVAALDEEKLTEEEVHGTCLSLLQAAPDTVASGVYQTVAWLCSPEGRPTQQRAFEAILDAYGGDATLAWDMAFREERVPLISSMNKETLRFYTFAPYATPRRATKDVIMPDGVILPAGITVILNAQQVNHDEAHFGEDAWTYKPDRFVGSEAGLPHVAFGAGSRICPAVAISNRIIYALLVRLILAFEMEGGAKEGKKPNVHPVEFSDVYDQLVAHPRFYDCHFKVRDGAWLEGRLSQGATSQV
ncbi:cytochrome P450 [Xylariaceae sp. FL0016]|nr:cytochrome P450 [Xylariaceae sp. FL0016]